MRYNVFDLYEGNVRGDKLKEIALKLEYAKPAKVQGVNGKHVEINEEQLLSGLNPSTLSLLKFEAKFKNMDHAPISELIQDINFKNAIFNVAVNAARLDKLFTELKQLHFKEQEIEKAIIELKHLIHKDKQTEKERIQQDAAMRQQIEAQNQELQRMIKDYMQQRAEKIQALEDTIKDLNSKMKELVAYDKEILKQYSDMYATTLDSAINKNGEIILRNMSEEDRKTYALNINNDFYNIDKKYDAKIEKNNQRIAEIDKELTQQNGTGKSSFNQNTGSVNTAFNLHAGKSSSQTQALQKEKESLLKVNVELNVQRKDEKREAVIKHAKAGGVDVTKEEAEILSDHASNNKINIEMVALRDSVRKEVGNIQNSLDTIKVELTEIKKEDQEFVDLLEDSQFEGLDNFDISGIDLDISDLDFNLTDIQDLTTEFIEPSEIDSSASLRTKLN